MNKYTLIVGTLLIASLLLAIQLQLVSALAILKFKVPKTVAADQSLTVNGTSMAPNATATDCNVQMQTNQAGYQPVTPLGQGADKFVNWTATTPPLKAGLNSLEAQLTCFPPGHAGNANLIKHLVHNVTALTDSNSSNQTQSPINTNPNAPAVQGQ